MKLIKSFQTIFFSSITQKICASQKKKRPRDFSLSRFIFGGPSVSRTQYQRILVCDGFPPPWTMPSPYQRYNCFRWVPSSLYTFNKHFYLKLSSALPCAFLPSGFTEFDTIPYTVSTYMAHLHMSPLL